MSSSIKCVISAGCSIAWGDELIDKNKRYANIIADKLGVPLIDVSAQGSGNEFISGQVIDAAYKCKFAPQEVLVIVNWSHAERLTYYDIKLDALITLIRNYSFRRNPTNGLFKFTYHYDLDERIDPFVVQQWYQDHDYMVYLRYKLVNTAYYTQLALQQYNTVFTCVDNNTYKILMMQGDANKHQRANHKRPLLDAIVQKIDTSKYFTTFMHKLAWENNHTLGPRGHPLEQTHIEYAELLWKYLNENRGINAGT